jgi:hypothetical protein
VPAYPSIVYIIRHGEKLGDPASDSDSIVDLSIRGSARAAALPSLFISANPQLSVSLTSTGSGYGAQFLQQTISGPAARFSRPDFLFATKASSNSNRPVETITPLAGALNLPISANVADKDFDCLVSTLQESTYTGKVVLICWHHGNIPGLAKKLGIANPPAWDATVFDRVWEIAYDAGGPTLLDQPQQLLFGDAEI